MNEKTDNERRPSESTIDADSCELKQHEGGHAAWCTVAGSMLVYYSSFGIMNSFGFFQDYYTHDFLKDTPTSTIAFCGTLQMFLMNSLAAVSGALCDHYGVTVFIILSYLFGRWLIYFQVSLYWFGHWYYYRTCFIVFCPAWTILADISYSGLPHGSNHRLRHSTSIDSGWSTLQKTACSYNGFSFHRLRVRRHWISTYV
jgi:hypothetical protein